MKRFFLLLLISIVALLKTYAQVYYYIPQGVDPYVGGYQATCYIFVKDNSGYAWIMEIGWWDENQPNPVVDDLQYNLTKNQNFFVDMFNKTPTNTTRSQYNEYQKIYQEKRSDRWGGGRMFHYDRMTEKQRLTKCVVYSWDFYGKHREFSISHDLNTMVVDSESSRPIYYKRYDASVFRTRRSADDLF